MAYEAVIDKISTQADQMVDEAKYADGPKIIPLPEDRSMKSQNEFMAEQVGEYMKFLLRGKE